MAMRSTRPARSARRAGALLVVVALVAVLPVVLPAVAEAAPAAPTDRTVGEGEGLFTPISPVRLLDTRKPVSPSNPWTGTFGPATRRDLLVRGRAGIPAEATAAVVNVTVTGGTAASDLRLWSSTSPTPSTSNLNWDAGETAANLAVVPLSPASGSFAMRNQSGDVHVIVDVQGWYGPTGDTTHPVTPTRALDTRRPGPLAGALGPGQQRDVTLTGVAGIPSDAAAAVVNLTAVAPSEATDLRAWPTGDPRPSASNLNLGTGDTRPNLAIVPLGDGGRITVRNQSGTVHLVVDVVAHIGGTPTNGSEGSAFRPVEPRRIFDTRDAGSPLAGPFQAAQTRSVTVTGDEIPDTATAVVVNLTVTGGSAPSDLRAWPTGTAVPTVSNLNWSPGDTRPNLALVPVGDDGRIDVRNQAGTVHVIADVMGYTAPLPPPGPVVSPLTATDVPVVEDISCTSPEWCMAVGDGAPRTDPGTVAVWDGQEWSTVAAPPFAVDEWTRQGPTSVQCGTPTACVIEYSSGDELGGEWVTIQRWDGTGFALLDTYPCCESLDATTTATCSADGTCTTREIVGGRLGFPLLECASATWCIGSDWFPDEFDQIDTRLKRLVPGPVEVMPVADDLDSWGASELRCDSPVACASVGSAVIDGANRLVIATWDGTEWSAAADLAVPAGLRRVAGDCASATECVITTWTGPAADPPTAWDVRIHRWADGVLEETGTPVPSTRAGSCVPALCRYISADGTGTFTVTWPD